MTEEWRDIPGYEGLYQASTEGRIKSLSYRNTGREQILKPRKHSGGYLSVTLCKDGKANSYLIHRLVYKVFKGSITEGTQINHINENKTDNRLENLNPMTPIENCNWGTRNKRGAKTRSKMVEQYTLEGVHFMTWFSIKCIEEELGFDHSCITKCCKGKAKTHKGYIWKYAE